MQTTKYCIYCSHSACLFKWTYALIFTPISHSAMEEVPQKPLRRRHVHLQTLSVCFFPNPSGNYLTCPSSNTGKDKQWDAAPATVENGLVLQLLTTSPQFSSQYR